MPILIRQCYSIMTLLYVQVSFSDNLCKQFGPKMPGLIWIQTVLDGIEKINRQQKRMQNYSAYKELNGAMIRNISVSPDPTLTENFG